MFSQILFLTQYYRDPLQIKPANQYGYKSFELGAGFILLQSAEDVILGMGDNRFGQCGVSVLEKNYIDSPMPLSWPKGGPFFANQIAAGYQFGLAADSIVFMMKAAVIFMALEEETGTST